MEDKIAQGKVLVDTPASADEVMLDEFFSLVARIASRLTKDDLPTHNVVDSVSREAEP